MKKKEKFQTLKLLKDKGYSSGNAAKRINRSSFINARNWSDAGIAQALNTKVRMPIGWKNKDWPKTDLNRLRLYELQNSFKSAQLDSCFWFVSNQINDDQWLVDNPFLSKQLIVSFKKSHGQIDSYYYGIENGDNSLIETTNLLEAILLGQP